ncbi:hypothetical protein [Xenorhabdus bovienii]|uniref:hypothetical protein n=1 Tax=Xenorhabdus bovienii TaxID=40576 RepID=UPI0023B267A7|nr:hypothetical protein [Xenorhabdus bovienii]MDE9544558.1 hypothetical protein [Xenorhabdus bovienii]MDE9550723.1 hypothetical protein [Xenorhabdus bovienii]
MSQFEHINISGNNNQFGDNNVQHNTINNNNNNGNNNNKDEENAPTLLFGVAVGSAAIVWWFFNNIEKIYYYLNIITLSSAILSFLSLCVLIFNEQIKKEDFFRFLGSVISAVGLFALAIFAYNHAPSDIIQLSQKTKLIDFWKNLTEYGKNVALSNFISSIIIAISAIFAHFSSLRQFAYSLSNTNRTGLWYSIYSSMKIFKMRISTFVFILASGLVLIFLNGKFPGLDN